MRDTKQTTTNASAATTAQLRKIDADARLLASAPALLAALQGLLTLRYFKGVEEMRGTTIAKIAVEKLDAARAALALATGGVK